MGLYSVSDDFQGKTRDRQDSIAIGIERFGPPAVPNGPPLVAAARDTDYFAAMAADFRDLRGEATFVVSVVFPSTVM